MSDPEQEIGDNPVVNVEEGEDVEMNEDDDGAVEENDNNIIDHDDDNDDNDDNDEDNDDNDDDGESSASMDEKEDESVNSDADVASSDDEDFDDAEKGDGDPFLDEGGLDDEYDSWEDPYPELSLEEMEQKIIAEIAETARLRRETECLQRYYDRQKVDIPEEDEDEIAQAAVSRRNTGALTSRRSRTARSATRQGTSLSRGPTSLSAAQKGDILQKNLDLLKTQYQTFKDESRKELHNLQASIAEAEVRLMEIPNLMALFENDVTLSSETSRSNKVETETLERFYQRRMKQCEDLIDKMNVKNVGLKKLQSATTAKLKQKDELSNQLHQVDFEQLKIENEQFALTISARNKDLSKLKATGGRLNQLLSSHKDDLRRLLAENNQLKQDIESRYNMAARVEKEMNRVSGRLKKLTSQRNTLKKESDEYRVPDVMELVKQQAALPKLNKSVKTMKKKVDIAQMELKATKRGLRH